MPESESSEFEAFLQDALTVPEARSERVDKMWEQITRRTTRKLRGAGMSKNQWSLWAGSWRLGGLIFLAIILSLLGIFFSTPPGRVVAEKIWTFFTFTQSNSKPIPTSAAQDMPAGSQETPFLLPTATNAKPVQPGYILKEPQVVPPGYQFSTAFYNPETGSSQFAYLYPSPVPSEWFTLSLSPTLARDEVGSNARLETIFINGLKGDLVQGGWMALAGETHETWDPRVPVTTLRWFDGEIFLKLQFHWNELSDPANLSLAQMVQVAESVRPTRRYETQPIPYASSHSVLEMEARFGHNLLEPNFLPDGYQLVKIEQVPTGRPEVIAIYRPAKSNGAGPELSIYQLPRQNFEEIKPYFGKGVERVDIAGIQGRFQIGVNDGSGRSPGWWLHWETSDLLLAIWFYPGPNASAEETRTLMVEIAKSMK